MNKPKYILANMEKSDVSKVVELDAISFGRHHWDSSSFYSELQNNLAHYYTAKDENGNILGYIGFWLIFEEAHITNVSVHPDYRRKKIAQILLKEMIQCCYDNMVKFITLEVRVSNIAAISLYEKFGFKSVGVRKGYYQDNNEDAMIMFTNNIFYSQFKENYAKITEDLDGVVTDYDKAFRR